MIERTLAPPLKSEDEVSTGPRKIRTHAVPKIDLKPLSQRLLGDSVHGGDPTQARADLCP